MKYDKVITAFERNGYKVSYFEDSEDASQYILKTVKGLSVGFGDSKTLEDMQLAEQLRVDNQVFDPSYCVDDDFLDVGKKALNTDVFFTSVNGATETGELVNMDGTGNRIAGSLFGYKKIYFVFGTNKIEATLEKAIWRTRNIAAPQNAKRLGYKTPCAIKGDRCYNCSSPDRICNALVIYYKKMHSVEVEIVMINQVLGY